MFYLRVAKYGPYLTKSPKVAVSIGRTNLEVEKLRYVRAEVASVFE